MRSLDTFPEEIDGFVRMSRAAGERFDLIQAGGGNTSVKLADGTMLIKASGFHLTDVGPGQGYSRVDLDCVLGAPEDPEVRSAAGKREKDGAAARRLLDCIVDGGPRPSIETFLHALLDRYTLHTHPLVVNAAACRNDWREVLGAPAGDDAAFVPYGTPGLELALRLKSAVDDHTRAKGRKPRILFLQNHGLITSGDDAATVFAATERIVASLEQSIGADLDQYKLTNRVSALLNGCGGPPIVSYLSRDVELTHMAKTRRQLLFERPFCPDGLVYCGAAAVEIKGLDAREPIVRYREAYGEAPRVVVFGDRIFFTGQNIRKTREAEEVFKFQVLALLHAGGTACSLSAEELNYLGNWEAEQYRRKL